MRAATPFADALAAVRRRGPRFFVPGHKGSPAAIPAFGRFLSHDLTEVDGAGDLSRLEGPLWESQQNMAKAYQSGATLYSAAGSTSCIEAMLALFCKAGGAVVAARGCHVAAVRGMALLGLVPAWVPLAQGRPAPGAIDAALRQSGAKAVYVTSPDYYGRMADIAALAAVCKAHGAALLVDGAHGAHLKFVHAGAGAQSLHPIALGAHACADSAHKTLPCLTPAALLHLQNPALAEDARAALNLFSSTSPAYPVLESLDLCAGGLLNAPPDFNAAAARLAQAATAYPGGAFFTGDPLKLVLRPAAVGHAPKAFHQGLLRAGIAPEYFNGEALVLMASPWNKRADFAKLEKTLKQLWQTLSKEKPNKLFNNLEYCQNTFAQADAFTGEDAGETVCPPREALFGPQRAMPPRHAAGQVMAGLCVPCPPGVPLALPGQRVTPAVAAALANSGVSHINVVI